MVQKTFSVALDIKRPTANRDFEVVEGDNGNVLLVTLTDDGAAVNLTGCRVLAVFSKSDGHTAEQDTDGRGVTVTAPNKLTISLYTTSVSPGLVECELQVYSDSNATLVTSARFNFKCRRGIANGDTVQATDEWPVLVGLIERTEAVETAETGRVLAEGQRAAAETGRVSAETARVTAEQGRATAESARANTEAARTSAETFRVNAEDSRASAESGRASTETTRASAEAGRTSAESSRASAESMRVTAENGRASAEAIRQTAEAARASHDTAFQVFEAYDNTKTYVPLNKAAYNGSSYVCIAATTGNAPPNAAYWLMIAARGADGTGVGDMLKSTYDADNDGVADNAAKLGGQPPSYYGIKPVVVQKTLAASGWASAQQTIADASILAASAGDVRIAQGATAAELTAWMDALPQVTAQTTGSVTLTARGTVPAINIPVLLEVRS